MEIHASKKGPRMHARLCGELDHHSAEQARNMLDTMLHDITIRDLTLDLSGVTFTLLEGEPVGDPGPLPHTESARRKTDGMRHVFGHRPDIPHVRTICHCGPAVRRQAHG